MTSERAFLTAFFRELNKTDVRYAILRNYESLPDSAGGSDLDILVSPGYEAQAKAIVFQVIGQAGGVPIGYINSPSFFQVAAIGKSEDQWWGQCIDIYFGLVHRSSARIAKQEDIDLVITEHRTVPVIRRDIAASIGVIKTLLAHNALPNRYRHEAACAVRERWNEIRQIFEPMGDKALSIYGKIMRGDPGKDISKLARHFRNAFIWHAFLSVPIKYSIRKGAHELSRLRRYIRPPGIIIAVLGVDGVGKSTVINAIFPVLDAATHKAVFVQHLRPRFLPPLARLKGKADLPAGPVLDPHGSAPSGAFGSLFRLSYLTLDYILGYWLYIRPKIAKQPAVVLYDRYAYDLALDPRRFRIGLPGRVAGWFASLAPKPDLILCLHAAPEVIAARKQELPLEETRRQVETLRNFAQQEPTAMLISTEGSVDEIREQVLQTLCDFLEQRAKK